MTISFTRGVPSLDIVDLDGLRAAAERAFAADPAGATAYGTSVGYAALREWIADKHGVAPQHVIVTDGSMQAGAFLFDALVATGDAVVVERPTYDRTLSSLQRRGADLRPVDMEAAGVSVAEIEALLDAGVMPSIAHLIPNFHNPAGCTLSREKRLALVALASTRGFTIFEDDPYGDLRFSCKTLPTMVSLDTAGAVVYASSFSKTICPGIRVGYLVGPESLIARVARLATNAYIAPNMVAQAVVNEFCRSGAIERSIETVKAPLGQRAATLCTALERELPEARFVEPEGGYFLWVELPEGTDGDALFTAAAERGVHIVKGTDFLLKGGENAFRLTYSGVTPAQIEEGVARLATPFGRPVWRLARVLPEASRTSPLREIAAPATWPPATRCRGSPKR